MAAQASAVHQGEQRPISDVPDTAEDRLDLLGAQRPRPAARRWAPLQAGERVCLELAPVLMTPAHKAAQRCQTAIEGAGGQAFLDREERCRHLVRQAWVTPENALWTPSAYQRLAVFAGERFCRLTSVSRAASHATNGRLCTPQSQHLH